MKTLFISVVALLAAMQASAQNKVFDRLVWEEKFTELNRLLQQKDVSVKDRDIYEGILYSVFGKPEQSNLLIKKVLTNNTFSDSLTYQLLLAQNNNYVNLFDYRSAYESGQYLMQHFGVFYKPNDIEDEMQEQKILQALEGTPPTIVKMTGVTEVPVTRDMAKLQRIPVRCNDSVYDFVLDSGAGLSCVTRSYADALHMKMLPAEGIRVKSGITDIANPVKVAIAPPLKIGNVLVENAVFIVFPDSAFTFPISKKNVYKINAIIGFPVMKELGSLTFYGDRIRIAQDHLQDVHPPNMAIVSLQPVIYLAYDGEDLPFTWDTGASQSILSEVFYRKYKSIVDKLGKDRNPTFGGAGGIKKFTVKRLRSVKLESGGTTSTLKHVIVNTEKINASDDVYYGNLGQDLMSQYGSVTIDFKASTLSFN